MYKRDYHNFALDDALFDVERLIGDVRAHSTNSDDAEFITGRGQIRGALFALLGRYGLSPHYQIGNDGVILCFIE